MTRKASNSYHQPVMAGEIVELIVTDPKGAYLDLTVGGGGYPRALSPVLDKEARIYGVDKDPDAVAEATRVLESLPQTCKISQSTFGDISQTASDFGEDGFDGIVLDLGLSSRQIDDPERGFSFQQDGPLDMRFDKSGVTTAADLVNTLSEKDLIRIFREYGEERGAVRIARAIVKERQNVPIRMTRQLATIVSDVIRPPHQTKSLARVFQALRIAVNQELEELQKVLPSSLDLLKSGGRVAVVSYHSLEDRMVKRFFQANAKVPEIMDFPVPVDPDAVPLLKIITRKPLVPGEDEIERNPRARSAKLRVAEKN